MDEWLDNQTRAILRKHLPPVVTTASGEESYALLLLERGPDHARIDDAMAALGVDACTPPDELSFLVAHGLSLEDAFVGRFTLACCDCVTMFVPDEIAWRADRAWWRQFYKLVMSSSDFQQVFVHVMRVPATEEGRRFCWQFLGLAVGAAIPGAFQFFRVKAELMEHWANKIGAVLHVIPRG